MSLILSTTFRGNAHLCDPLAKLLGRLWPGHPELWFLTDGGRIRHPNTVRVPSAKTWTEVFHLGMQEVFRRVGAPPRVYVVLEDLLPIRAGPFADYARVEALAERRDLNCVVFPCYPMSWDPAHTVEFDGRRFLEVHEGFCPFSQLQAATWKTTHLLATCEEARRSGKLSAWQFEGIRIAGGHYIAELPWPTAYHGLLHNRLVNRRAIPMVQRPEGSVVWWMLVRGLLSEVPYRVRRRLLR